MSSRQPHATPVDKELRDQMDVFWDCLVGRDGDPQRAYPRIRMDASIVIESDGVELPARLYDIGRGGVQVRCGDGTRARLAPETGSAPVPVTLRATLPDGGGRLALEARCALVHVTVLEARKAGKDKNVALGFRFEELEPKARKALERFIISAMKPAGA